MNIDASEINEHMAVRDSEGREVGKVDAVEGDFLKLKEEAGVTTGSPGHGREGG